MPPGRGAGPPPSRDDPERNLAGLGPDARRRLEAFGRAFERLGAGEYALFSTAPIDGDRHAAARAAAEASLGPSGRAATASAAEAFVAWAAAGYSNRLALPDTFLLFQSLPDRPEDRVRFRAALESAVLGIVAWDALDADDLAELLGPFAEMAARAIGLPAGDDLPNE